MAVVTVNGTGLGNSLQELLLADEIVPGAAPGYQLCKTIYAYHPLGRKLVDSPIVLAQSQQRMITIGDAPENRVRKAFEDEWRAINANDYISQLGSISRIYGIGSIVVGAVDVATDEELPPDKLADLKLYFNVLDPLNTAGSMTLNQNPNAPDFLKVASVSVNGEAYHRSRVVVLMHERPVYIEYTASGFGYVGRSVFQRGLYPLKSFVATMATDDMIARKAGLLIAKMKSVGSIIDWAMKVAASVKRAALQIGITNNVLTIDISESIESLNLQNIDTAGKFARTNILKNIATSADMPAVLLENETLNVGFGEGFNGGAEDAKTIARYVDGIRAWLGPAYLFFDDIVMRRAWNENFYKTIQKEFPGHYKNVTYKAAFYRWKNSFQAVWPSLLDDPDANAKAEDVRQKAMLGMLEVLLPAMDPENKALVIQWAVDNAGENKILFPQALTLDYEALAAYTPPNPQAEPSPPRPF